MMKIVHSTVDPTNQDFWELTLTPRGNSGSSSKYMGSRLGHFKHIAEGYGIRVHHRRMGPKAAITYFNKLLSAAKRAA